jgi:CBS domain-containing protein
MLVKEAMTRNPEVAAPEETLEDAARVMLDLDIGAMPVCEDGRLVGMVTDRDIAVRGVAQGKGPTATLRDVMSIDAVHCLEDEEIEEVSRRLAEQQVKRLPVLDREQKLVGMLALSDVAGTGGRKAAGEAEAGIARPGGLHSQG